MAPPSAETDIGGSVGFEKICGDGGGAPAAGVIFAPVALCETTTGMVTAAMPPRSVAFAGPLMPFVAGVPA